MGLHPIPSQAIVTENLGGVRTVGGERPVVDLAVGKVGHGRQIERAAVVGRMASTVSIGGIGVGQAGVIAGQLAVRIADHPEPVGRGLPGETEFRPVVVTNGADHGRTLRAERHGIVVIVAASVGRDRRAMQHVGQMGSRIADVVTQVVGDGHVLDGHIQDLAGEAGLQAPMGVDGPIDAARVLVLFHGLHAGVDGRVARIRVGSPEVDVFDEAADVYSRRRTAGGATATDVRGRSDVCETRIVHSVNAIVPVVAAEGAARQTHFHDVVEHAVAAVDLDLAVMEQVISAAQAGSNLLAPAEIDGREPGRIVGRHMLLVETETQVEGQAMPHVPRVLDIDGMSGLLGGTSVGNGLAADLKVPIPALTGRLPEVGQIRRHNGVAGGGAGNRRVALAPEEVDGAAVEEAQHIFRLPLPEIPNLKRVGAA